MTDLARDRLVDAALRYADNEQAIRSVTRRMHASRCKSSPTCWAQDDTWKDPKAEIPDSYCDECVRSSILCRERHDLKMRRWTRKEILLRRAADFKDSGLETSPAGPCKGSGVNHDHDIGGRPCIHPSTVNTLA